MSVLLDSVELPEQLRLDGDDVPAVTQTVDRMVDGTLVIEEQILEPWLAIELSDSSNNAVISQATRSALLAKQTMGNEMVLVYHDQTWDVRFRYADHAIETRTLTEYLPDDSNSVWYLTLRLFGKKR